MAGPQTFADLVCSQMEWPPEAYAQNVFRICLYAHAIIPARIIERVKPSFFEPDFRVIERVGKATTPFEFDKALQEFHAFNVRHPASLRCRWGIRVSGRKVGKFHSDIFGEELPNAEQTAFLTKKSPLS